MAQFNFTTKQDTYLVTNEEPTAITFEVKKLYDCVDYLTVFDGVIQPGETRKFEFNEDAEYQIILDGTDTIIIRHYLRLLTSIIEGVLETVCDCNCGCDCSEEEETMMCKLLMLRAKLDLYRKLKNPEGAVYYNAIDTYAKRLIEEPVYCAVNKEIILGESECNLKLVKQLVGLDYLAIYFNEFSQAYLTEDKQYVREKFNTKTIFCCIQSLGIDIGDIEDIINDYNMGLFTINSGAYVNQPPSAVGDYELTVANRAVTALTLAMFTTLTTPAFSDPEGDAPEAVRIDSLPIDGTLKLGITNVTVGQVILAADINAGNLTYESPNQDLLDQDTFTFSVSDVGSGLFAS